MCPRPVTNVIGAPHLHLFLLNNERNTAYGNVLKKNIALKHLREYFTPLQLPRESYH